MQVNTGKDKADAMICERLWPRSAVELVFGKWFCCLYISDLSNSPLYYPPHPELQTMARSTFYNSQTACIREFRTCTNNYSKITKIFYREILTSSRTFSMYSLQHWSEMWDSVLAHFTPLQACSNTFPLPYSTHSGFGLFTNAFTCCKFLEERTEPQVLEALFSARDLVPAAQMADAPAGVDWMPAHSSSAVLYFGCRICFMRFAIKHFF